MYKRLLLLAALGLGIFVRLEAQPGISPNELKKRMARQDDYVLLDVRTPEEVKDGYIDGAVNIDFKADDFETRISELDKSKTYYLYCASGVRSGKAATVMLDQGFNTVYSLNGGFNEWKKKKLPYIQND